MRLIDTEKLEEYKADCCVSLTEWQQGWNDAIDTIMNEAPTVDEVIRCKDCKYRMTELFNDKKTMYYCPFVDRYTVNDWYCADGERKDNE